MSEYIGRKEHDEMLKRMDAEHKRIDDEQQRQNKRLCVLEETVKQFTSLTISVEKMAVSMENMFEEQKKQGKKLDEIENAPAKNWNTLKASVLSAIGGAVGAAIIAAIINFM